MTREIKFRVWEPFNSRMIYDPFSFRLRTEQDTVASDEDTSHIFESDFDDYYDGIHRDGYVMQFTGLLDKNGKEKYVGDVISYPNQNRVFRIEFIAPAFWEVCINDTSFGKSLCTDGLGEVIGNIYQDKHLLS